MTENEAEPAVRAPDRLDLARQLAAWAFGLLVIGALVVALGAPAREAAQPDTRPAWAAALGSTQPMLWPAGSVERVPTSHPAVRPELSWGLRHLVPPLAEKR